MADTLIRVTMADATFGLVVDDNKIVVRAAPIARYTLGWTGARAYSYFANRGAHVEVLDG